ncbi:hypothetical protein LRY65_04530 [Candidatus Woesebacteria bacterium]|nr:hypothetical protein [Candidatus Woesebacteria bacterium]MCD8507596.1 hypothetical protein [Candidatus Woesebacteria bacterium]MCD8527439.1 hypothetical protein [Candidatus Woesebacteria bacterium]MCD8546182.1 hypothetical protein [Candidatus Woesebacteria bacterium]
MAFQRVTMKTQTATDTNGSTPTSTAAPAEEKQATPRPEAFRMRTVAPDSSKKQSLFDDTKEKNTMKNTFSRKTLLIGALVMVVLGLSSGFAGAYLTKQSGGVAVVPKENQKTAQEVENAVRVGAVFGVPDEKTFSDDTTGVLITGGLEGEGSHTLLRPGGESQNVYLTSSVVDLDQFEGHRVHIWGETFKGQKAGWLMDVGRIEVEELDADKPEWYTESQ